MTSAPREGKQQPHAPSTHLCLHLHSPPLIHSSFHRSLAFELLLFLYYTLFTLICINTHNTRVIIYCLLFTANQTLKIVYSLMDAVDPLAITPAKNIMQLFAWAIKANMVYQLCALAYLEPHVPIIIMIGHFILNNFKRHRPDQNQHQQKGKLFHKILDFINPILLYSFLKQFDNKQSDLSIIFLIFLCVNLIGTSEIRLILSDQESDIVGWSVRKRVNGNKKLQIYWDYAYALKLIIMGASIVLVLQNFLLMFESIKSEVTFNIMHTLIVAVAAYLIFRAREGAGSRSPGLDIGKI